MSVLLVNGSPNRHGCTDRAFTEITNQLKKHGIETEYIWLGKGPVQDCIACNKCQTEGKCVFDDIVNEISAKLDTADGLIIGSPVYYGGPDGRITSIMDRLCFSATRKFNLLPAAAIVSCRRGGGTDAYERLNMYLGNVNAIIPASQYWNQVHGFTAEDVEKDEEGLQTMRALADNMAYLIESRRAADKAGVKLPEREAWTPTHFIR